jgi:hypothetical protein
VLLESGTKLVLRSLHGQDNGLRLVDAFQLHVLLKDYVGNLLLVINPIISKSLDVNRCAGRELRQFSEDVFKSVFTFV